MGQFDLIEESKKLDYVSGSKGSSGPKKLLGPNWVAGRWGLGPKDCEYFSQVKKRKSRINCCRTKAIIYDVII